MIHIHGIARDFRGETLLQYADLTFETGKSYVLLGASGCGKTTLLNMIAGVLSPTMGAIEIDGVDMTKRSRRERDRFRIQNIGYIFQDFKLIEEMTVEDNIRVLELEGVDTSALHEILDALYILPLRRRKVARLSGGEKQRVSIARALVKRPAIILADEPTGNLHYEIGREVIERLIAVCAGKTLIAVTHDERLVGYFDHAIDLNQAVTLGEVARNA
ncbi:MAG: ABC transporter ATP-binding protein [Christensenellales bacterium]|jgi:putative ABC transport system ATP-binding protein